MLSIRRSTLCGVSSGPETDKLSPSHETKGHRFFAAFSSQLLERLKLFSSSCLLLDGIYARMPRPEQILMLFAAVFSIYHPTASGTCPIGKTAGFAFCCCKKIYVDKVTSSIMPSTSFVASTTSASNESSAMPSMSSSISTSSIDSSYFSPSTSIASTPSFTASTPLPTPTPEYRGDGCFLTEKRYGYFNECYCNYTRYNYVGFNNSNGYYTTNPNATNFGFKCWNLPKPKLYIGGLIDTETELGKKIIVAADMAVDEVNKNDSVLPGYELFLLRQNSTKHWISTGSGVLLDYLNQSPKKVAILGPDDNELAKTVAAIAGLPRYKLLQISYGTSAIELSLDHSKFYPYFFRTKPFLDLLYNKARIAMLERYRWRNVGLLFSNNAYFRKLNDNLRTQLQSKSISISIEEEFVTDPMSSLQHFQRKDVHVILGSFSGEDASRVLCAAYKLKMYGPLYVYLFTGYPLLKGIDGCTFEEVKCAARYQFFFNNKEESCSHKFVANYNHKVNETFFNTSTSLAIKGDQLSYGKYIYDSVHAIANVLHSVDTDKGNSSRFYLNYMYGSNDYGLKLRNEILKYQQCGASGKVKFDKEGNRYFPINVIQIFFGGGDKIIGDFDNTRSPDNLLLPHVKWPGNNKPFQEVKRVNRWRYISKGLYIAYCVFAGLGILFALFCIVVLIWRRKHKEVRHSFYPMNLVIIIGCILVYISVFLFGVDNIISPVLTVDRVCRARLWVFSIGFVLVVGGIIAKLWIVQDVLSRRILMEKKRRRTIMIGIVLGILVINIIILLCWHHINPLMRVIEYIKDEVKFYCDRDIWPDNPFNINYTAVEQCKCDNEIIWYFIIVIWKAFLLILAVYWAYQTRDVFIPTINDTQRCGLCSYIIAACSVIGLIIALSARLLPDVFFGLVGLVIIGCVTAVLIILFLHKILLVFACTRDRVIVKSATEEDDDANCFSRCLSKCCCGGAFCGCCTRCCKGNCPKCYLCLAACCAPFLLCCAPLIFCCSKLFSCCGSSCRNCCCGSKSQRHGTDKAGEQKFIVKGVGDDKSAELVRLQRELDMKNRYIENMKRNELPVVRPIWTQTTEPVILLSDTCDDDSDIDGNDKADGNGKGRGRKKRKRFRVLNRKLDFSNVKSRTDSNYKNGQVLPDGTVVKDNNDKVGKKSKSEQNGGHLPVVYISSGSPKNNDADVATLRKLLAERDAEIDRLRNGKKKNDLEGQEVDNNVENEMKRGLGFPAKDKSPQTVVIIRSDDSEKARDQERDSKRKGTDGNEEDLDALIEELDMEETPRGGYNRNKNKFKIYGQKLDWSQIPSKLRAAGLIHHSGTDGSNAGKTNKVSPEQRVTPVSSPSSVDMQSGNNRYSNNHRLSNIKIFHEKIDYSNIRSKIKPLLSNERGSISSSDTGSVRILNGPSEYNKKSRITPTSSSVSLNKPDARKNGSNRSLNESLPKTESKPQLNSNASSSPREKSSPENPNVNILSTPDDPVASLNTNSPSNPSNVQSTSPQNSIKPADSAPVENPKSAVKILNDPKDYSHVKSKLVPDPPPKPNSVKQDTPKAAERPKSDVKVLNDPKDYSHVRSKLVPDPPKPNSDQHGTPKAAERPKSDVKVLNDPKDYSHVRSKLVPDPPPKPNSDKHGAPKAAEKPKSDVKILNDPKDYSHVRSKLVPDPPPKPNSDKGGDASPRDKPGSNMKILNAPQNYNHVKSKLSGMGHEPKKSTVKIQNKPVDYSHVKSKLV